MRLAAFDPGKQGALATLGGALAPDVYDLPLMGAGKQIVLNGREIAVILTTANVTHAIIEHVHSMPKQGVVSVFKFGTTFGQILGIVQALGIPYELVSPMKWKRDMRLPGGDAKGEVARGRAIELYPDLAAHLARKKDHNRAEALLIGRWWQERNMPKVATSSRVRSTKT